MGVVDRFHSLDQTGFTLIEILMVLVMLSVLSAIAIPKYIDLDANAKDHAIDSGISELNGREVLVWSNIKISPDGFQGDNQVFSAVDYDLGADYDWLDGPRGGSDGGGTLRFQKSRTMELTRSMAEFDQPSKWARK